MIFILDNDGVDRNHAIFSSDGTTTLNGALIGTSATFSGTGTFGTLNSATIPLVGYASTSNIGLKLIGTSTGNGNGTYFYANNGSTLLGSVNIAGTAMAISNEQTGILYFATSGSEQARISSSGEFSIGTSSGGFKLNVNGTGNFSGALSGTSASFSSTATASAFIPSGATIPTNGMYLSGTNTLDFATNSTNRLSISSGGVATFNSGSNTPISLISSTSSGIEYTRGATIFGYIGSENNAAGGMRYNSIAGNFEHKFYNNSNLSLTIASTGAATFSNNIQLGTTAGTLRIGTNAGDFATFNYSGGGTSVRNDWASTSAFLDLLANSVGFRVLGTGNATLTGTLTQGVSDERFKKNIELIPNALEKINLIHGYTFEYDLENEDLTYIPKLGRDIGVLAQEIEKVIPEAVSLAPIDRNEDDESKSGKNYLTVNYEKIIPLLIQSIKELKAEIDILKNK